MVGFHSFPGPDLHELPQVSRADSCLPLSRQPSSFCLPEAYFISCLSGSLSDLTPCTPNMFQYKSPHVPGSPGIWALEILCEIIHLFADLFTKYLLTNHLPIHSLTPCTAWRPCCRRLPSLSSHSTSEPLASLFTASILSQSTSALCPACFSPPGSFFPQGIPISFSSSNGTFFLKSNPTLSQLGAPTTHSLFMAPCSNKAHHIILYILFW